MDAPEHADRLGWADVAKGMCIVLVVLHHVLDKSPTSLFVGSGVGTELWQRFDRAMLGIRLPAFFVVSGLLASRSLGRPWRAIARPRIANPYYLFVVWSAIQGALFALFAPRFPTDWVSDPGEFARNLVLPITTVWYLYALPLYFVLAKGLAGRVHPGLVLAAAAALFVAARSGALPSWLDGNVPGVLTYPLFFLLGAYAPGLVRGIPRAASWPRAVAGGAAFAAGTVVMPHLPRDLGYAVLLLNSLIGMATLLTLAALLSTAAPRSEARLAWIGRRTLPIYVLHLPLVALLELGAVALVGDAPPRGTLAVLWPPVATVAAIALALAVHRVVIAGGGRWLFSLPRRPVRTGRLSRAAG